MTKKIHSLALETDFKNFSNHELILTAKCVQHLRKFSETKQDIVMPEVVKKFSWCSSCRGSQNTSSLTFFWWLISNANIFSCFLKPRQQAYLLWVVIVSVSGHLSSQTRLAFHFLARILRLLDRRTTLAPHGVDDHVADAVQQVKEMLALQTLESRLACIHCNLKRAYRTEWRITVTNSAKLKTLIDKKTSKFSITPLNNHIQYELKSSQNPCSVWRKPKIVTCLVLRND